MIENVNKTKKETSNEAKPNFVLIVEKKTGAGNFCGNCGEKIDIIFYIRTVFCYSKIKDCLIFDISGKVTRKF